MSYDVAHAQLAFRACESQPLDLIPGFVTLVQGTCQIDLPGHVHACDYLHGAVNQATLTTHIRTYLEWELPCPVAGTAYRFLPVPLTDYFQLEAAMVPSRRAP